MSGHDEERPEIDAAAGYDKRDINVLGVLCTAIAILVFVTVAIFILDSYFSRVTEELRSSYDAPKSQLNELRAETREQLENYEEDTTTGVQRVPIDRAMELLVEEDQR
ncbi:MAG: hypothetical protein QGF67_09405 [Lentisphaeria bacterium]|jgi:hypothetical protein|nr:hypothetical protein [Lentisphaeria bacterium]MDP7741644.1 hypothetical protein [Lentisphaeria bacterium]